MGSQKELQSFVAGRFDDQERKLLGSWNRPYGPYHFVGMAQLGIHKIEMAACHRACEGICIAVLRLSALTAAFAHQERLLRDCVAQLQIWLSQLLEQD